MGEAGGGMGAAGSGEAFSHKSSSSSPLTVSLPSRQSTSWVVSLGRSTMVVEAPAEQAVEQAVLKARELAHLLYGGGPLEINPSQLRQHFVDLGREFRRDGAIERAVEATSGFVWPENAFTRDTEDLRRVGSVDELIRERQAGIRSSVLNEENVRTWFANDPEFSRLLDLAQNGVRVDVGPIFQKRSTPPPFRNLRLRLGKVWPAYACEVWQQGLAVLLVDSQMGEDTRAKLHYVHEHWFGQWDKERGRCLLDPSNADDPRHILNSPETTAAAIVRYGNVELPKIRDIIAQWAALSQRIGIPLSEWMCAKDDVDKAFLRVLMDPSSAVLMAVQVEPGLTMIPLTGQFGWGGMPAAFNVVSRALKRLLAVHLAPVPAVGEVYVDDVIEAGPAVTIATAQGIVHEDIPRVLGTGALSVKKIVRPAVCTTVLGWDCDFSQQHITPSAKLCRKALFVFWIVDPTQKQPLTVFEVLAGIAEHLSQGIRGTRPFVVPLHHMKNKFGGNRSLSVRHHLNAAARQAVEVWRAVTIILFAQRKRLAVPFSSFTRHLNDTADCLGLADGSPRKVAAAIFSRECRLLAYAVVRFPFTDVECLFQNVREYLGSILILILALSFSNTSVEHPARVAIIGDNRAAISWVDTKRTKSSVCQLATMATSWMDIHAPVEVAQVRHLSAGRIGFIDSLSRDLPHDFPRHLEVDLQSNPHVQELFRLLDPKRDSPNLINHHQALTSVVGVLEKLVASIPRTLVMPEFSSGSLPHEFALHPSGEVAVPPLEEGIFRGLEPTIRPASFFGAEASSAPR